MTTPGPHVVLNLVLTQDEARFVQRFSMDQDMSETGVMHRAIAMLSVIHDVPGARDALESAVREHWHNRIGPKFIPNELELAPEGGRG